MLDHVTVPVGGVGPVEVSVTVAPQVTTCVGATAVGEHEMVVVDECNDGLTVTVVAVLVLVL